MATQMKCMEKCPNFLAKIRDDRTSPTNSETEEFRGFDTTDIRSVIISNGAAEVSQIQEKDNNEQEAGTSQLDDDVILVEDNVEIIEIQDDDAVDNELPPCQRLPTDQSTQSEQLSFTNLYRMIDNNDPTIEYRKPELDLKSDQFRLIYINGVKQACKCTICSILFREINVDSLVLHSKCIPPPFVPPAKRSKLNKKSKYETALTKESDAMGISKIQAIAACMDLQSSTFFQSKAYVDFAKFLISKDATTYNPKKAQYDELCTYGDRLRESQQSTIRTILNTPDQDFSLSYDVWEDCIRKRTNLVLELHYFDLKFKRCRAVAGVRSIPSTNVDGKAIYKEIRDILKTYSNQDDGDELLQRATTIVTAGKLHVDLEKGNCFRSACSVINDAAKIILDDKQFGIEDMCVQMIGLLNMTLSVKILEFNITKWDNIFVIMKLCQEKNSLLLGHQFDSFFPYAQPIIKLLEPFHKAIMTLSEPKNNVTQVFGLYKQLANHLKPDSNDKRILRNVKAKALNILSTGFDDTDFYKICMFLDPFNKKDYNSYGADAIDNIRLKVNALINPCPASASNSRIDSDLLEYMDDNVSIKHNDVDVFEAIALSDGDVLEFWRDSANFSEFSELKKVARKYLTIPTYASLSECAFEKHVRQFLTKRNNLEIKDLEVMLIMKSVGGAADFENIEKNIEKK